LCPQRFSTIGIDNRCAAGGGDLHAAHTYVVGSCVLHDMLDFHPLLIRDGRSAKLQPVGLTKARGDDGKSRARHRFGE